MNDVVADEGGLATVYINLLSGSIGGPVIATTLPTTLPSGFTGNPTFFFASTVTLTPGVTYYFTPVATPNSAPINIFGTSLNYPGGSAFANGQPALQSDFWFREGLYVPEPSSCLLLLAGGAALLVRRKHKQI